MAHLLLPPSTSMPYPIEKSIGLSGSGRLYSGATLLDSSATSFTTTEDFLIYTTFTHTACFILLSSLCSPSPDIHHSEPIKLSAMNKEREGKSGLKRAVERGSRIVTAVGSATALVLQMPRGNLETVFPRPLVLKIVRRDIDAYVLTPVPAWKRRQADEGTV